MIRSLHVLIDRGKDICGEKWKVLLDRGGHAYPRRRAREEVMKLLARLVTLSKRGCSFWKEQSLLRWRRKVRHSS